MRNSLLVLQLVVVIFLALHDWVPLGRLNSLAGIRSVDSLNKRIWTTAISTAPFAAVLIVSGRFVAAGYPNWLRWWLWGTYLACAYGILRAWWIPYLWAADPERAQRYNVRFAGTHSFLPLRNGMRPDSLHVAFHSIILATLVLLGFLTFAHQ